MDVRRDTGPDMSTYLGIDITPSLGPLFWGTLVSMILTGTTIIQAYRYFPSKDRAPIQRIALSMLLLDLLSSALAAQGLYHYLLPNFGSTVPLGHLVPTLAAECATTTCIIVISQLYFAWQLYALAQKPFVKYTVSGVVVVLSLLAFAGGLGCSVVMVIHSAEILTVRGGVFNKMAVIAKAPAALADLIVTCYLCLTLGYVRTGVKATDSVIKTLTGFVIQRGVLVTVIQTALLIIFCTTSSHMYWLGLHVNMTRVYANTFFAMLNGRESLKAELQMKSFSASCLGTHGPTHLDGAFRLSKKGTDRESQIEVPQSVWISTIKGGKSMDTVGIAQIQVDQKVVVSEI